MREKLEKLHEEYKFDYIYLNPLDLSDVEFEIIPEEVFVDFKTPPGYFGTIKLNESMIEIYCDEKITSGDVIFKFKNIKKERKFKVLNITHNSSD
jgi:hypothetical protein